MNARFYLIIALLIILYGAWAFLAHTHGQSADSQYQALAKLPVYAYVADTTKVAPILSGIGLIEGIEEYHHETGYQAALELIEAYALPLSEGMIADYSFPDVITVTFKPGVSNDRAKTSLMYLLRTHLEESDIDSQSTAYSQIMQEIRTIKSRSLIFTIYAALMMLIIFIFSRLSYELHIYLKDKRKLVSVVDVMRHNRLNASHTWMMLLLPVALVTGAYYGGYYLSYWQNLAQWWEFAAMGGTALIATFVIVMMLRVYEHDRVLDSAPPLAKSNDEAGDA